LPRPSKAVPDVAIIDASLPLVGGLEVARQIRGRCPDTEIMAIAAHDAEPLARDLLHAGARAFLLKSERTRSVVAGSRLCPAKSPTAFAKTLLEAHLSPSERPPEPPLSPRERLVVQLIAEGPATRRRAPSSA
jgi:DNA-binding NarL/FixJ family response regulator